MVQLAGKPLRRPDVEGVLRRVLEETKPPGLVSAYLFGSRAEGRSHRESDVDIGALLCRETYRTAGQRFEARLRLAGWLGECLGGRCVDLVILNDAPPQLARHVARKGKRIFCSEPAADHAWIRDVQLRAADLEPFLRRTRLVKLAALER